VELVNGNVSTGRTAVEVRVGVPTEMVCMLTSRGCVVAGGMLREGTPLEDYTGDYGLWVKREDKACLPPGPAFSKARGVYARVSSRSEVLIGVLDTRHSQAGHAVARACQVLGKRCVNYYPEMKYEPGPRPPQLASRALGAELVGLPATRSSILFNKARRLVEARGGYMMPNALKLTESVDETAAEVGRGGLANVGWDYVLVPISSGTIASGVIRGLGRGPVYLAHMGYARPSGAALRYLRAASGVGDADIRLIDENYDYKDVSRPGVTPPWPCNVYYDLKAFRWWVAHRAEYRGRVLFWNIG
jgi:hypothetical protein